MLYDGSGSGNCFENNTLRSPNLPADNEHVRALPGPDPNVLDPAVLGEALTLGLGDPEDPASFEAHWIKHPHPRAQGRASRSSATTGS